jgi:hypothetical protein
VAEVGAAAKAVTEGAAIGAHAATIAAVAVKVAETEVPAGSALLAATSDAFHPHDPR